MRRQNPLTIKQGGAMKYLAVITSEQFQKNFIIKVIRDHNGKIFISELEKILFDRFNFSCLEICDQ